MKSLALLGFCSLYIVACFAIVNFESTLSTLPNFYHEYLSQPSGRVGFTTFTFNGDFYLTGGFPNVVNDDYACNDLWSTPMLGVVNFTQVSSNLTFSSRWGFQVMEFGSNLVLVGGSPTNIRPIRPATGGPTQALTDIWVSTNAVNWAVSTLTLPYSRAGYFSANITGAWFIYGGWNAAMSGSDMQYIMTSTDGVTWTALTSGAQELPHDIQSGSSAVFDGTVYIIPGYTSDYATLYTRYYYTQDFSSWSFNTIPTVTPDIAVRAGASAVVFNNTLFFIFGFSGVPATSLTALASIYSTTDGANWQPVCNTSDPCTMNARGYVNSAVSTVNSNNHIFIFGGFTGTSYPTSMLSSYDIWHYGELNDCITNNCQYGSCLDGIMSYTCNCTAGYSGTYCGNVIDNCGNSPCSNGGTCTNKINAYNCSCAAGWSGTTCTQLIDNCANSPCSNGATCNNYVNTYNCSCASGWKGTSCQTKSSASTITVSYVLVFACALLSSFWIQQ